MGKWCLHASLFIFDRIMIKVAGNQDRHKSLVKFDLGRIRPLILELFALEWRKFHTFELEYLWSQLVNLDQIVCVASLGWGKGCIMFWVRLTWHIGLRWAIVALWATCVLSHLSNKKLYTWYSNKTLKLIKDKHNKQSGSAPLHRLMWKWYVLITYANNEGSSPSDSDVP